MAVYTKIKTNDISSLFNTIGEINSVQGIKEGVENTNYLVTLKNQKKLIFVRSKISIFNPAPLLFFTGLYIRLV